MACDGAWSKLWIDYVLVYWLLLPSSWSDNNLWEAFEKHYKRLIISPGGALSGVPINTPPLS